MVSMGFSKTSKWGMLLLGIWLIVNGIVVLIPAVSFGGSANVMALLAIVAGALIVMDR
jgi:hypothetical protein